MAWTDDLTGSTVKVAGVAVPARKVLNFVAGATVVDNPATGATDITVEGAGGVADGAVTAPKLASGAVVTAKIGDGQVTATKLASDSVSTAKILNANVTRAKLEADLLALVDINTQTGVNVAAPAYGADRTGAVSSSTAFSNATADAYAAGVPVIMPTGRYLLDAPISNPASNTTFSGNFGRTILDVRITNGSLFEFTSSRTNVTWQNIVFTTPNTRSAALRAIYWDAACTDMTVYNCWFENFKNNGMRINPGTAGVNKGKRFRIIWSKFTNIYQNRSSSPINSICADDSVIAFNEIWDCGVGGVADISILAWQPSTQYLNGDTVTNGGKVYYNLGGTGISGSSGGPTGSTTSVDGGITWTYGTDVGHALVVQHAIYMSGGCDGLAIIGNKIRNADGIDCGVTAGGTTFTDLLLQGNFVKETNGSPAFVFAAVYGATVTQNFCSTVATGVQMLLNNDCEDFLIDENTFDQGGLDSVTSLQIGFSYGTNNRIKVKNNRFRNPVSASTGSIGINIIGGNNVTVDDRNHFLDLAYGVLVNTDKSIGLYIDNNYAERKTGNTNFQFVSIVVANCEDVFIRKNDVNGGHVINSTAGGKNFVIEKNEHFNAFSTNPMTGTYTGLRVSENIGDAWLYQKPSGTNVVFSKNRLVADLMTDANTSITAFAGGGQASATQLTAVLNVIGTVATTGDSVKVKSTSGADCRQTIVNSGANSANVYPPSGGQIDALGTDNPLALAAGAVKDIIQISSTQWVSK